MSIMSTKCKVHGKLHVKWGKNDMEYPVNFLIRVEIWTRSLVLALFGCQDGHPIHQFNNGDIYFSRATPNAYPLKAYPDLSQTELLWSPFFFCFLADLDSD